MHLHLLLPAILLPAKGLGEAARRIRIPGVIGEIGAGVLLGPALLRIIPSASQPGEDFALLKELASIGLCGLLFKMGLDTHLGDLARVWRPAAKLSIAGVILPFLFGWGLGWLWGWGQQPALFVGATLVATSLGVTASVLHELRAQSSREGTLIFSAAILDDIVGLLLFSVLAALIAPGVSVFGPVALALAQAVALIAGGLLVGSLVVRLAVRLDRWTRSKSTLLVLAFSFLLLMAYAAKAAGLVMIIGAYAAGLAFARHPERARLEEDLNPLISLLTPLFYVLIGASIDFSGFHPFSLPGLQSLGNVLLLFVVAVAGKMLAAVVLGGERVNRLAVGSGMIPRGGVGFVFAQVGLTAGIFSPELYSRIALALIGTTLAGPILLRFFWSRRQNSGPLVARDASAEPASSSLGGHRPPSSPRTIRFLDRPESHWATVKGPNL